MKKLLIIGIIILSSALSTNAQDYLTGIGLRGGLSNGITIKHFVSEDNALEGIVSLRWKGLMVTGLYEFERYLDVPGLSWYYGGGAHIGFWNAADNDIPWADAHDNYTVIGVDGIIGIEYTFEGVPINISLDWKPAINLIGYTGLWADEGAFSIRYIIR